MKTIKAIETSYRGYKFRSRLEARWAIFFDEMGFQWGYEIEGFELPEGKRYLPDFYLYDFSVWFEVKGNFETVSNDDFDIMYDFSSKLKQNIILSTGQPGDEIMMFYSQYGLYQVWFSPNPFTGEFQISVMREDSLGYLQNNNEIYKRTDNAYQKARSARFEFGERK